jgi:hypothetical protein
MENASSPRGRENTGDSSKENNQRERERERERIKRRVGLAALVQEEGEAKRENDQQKCAPSRPGDS